jgi:hypothetical protein
MRAEAEAAFITAEQAEQAVLAVAVTVHHFH